MSTSLFYPTGPLLNSSVEQDFMQRDHLDIRQRLDTRMIRAEETVIAIPGTVAVTLPTTVRHIYLAPGTTAGMSLTLPDGNGEEELKISLGTTPAGTTGVITLTPTHASRFTTITFNGATASPQAVELYYSPYISRWQLQSSLNTTVA